VNSATKILIATTLLLPVINIPARAEINIKSDNLNILKQGTVSRFTGNVKVRSKDLFLEADKAVSDKENSKLTAAGQVKVNYSSGSIKIISYSTRAVLESDKNIITMTGNVKNIIYSDEIVRDEIVRNETGRDETVRQSSKTVVYADSLRIDYSSKDSLKSEFTGSVKVESEKINIYSENAVYDRAAGLISFTGSPRAFSVTENSRIEYSGDKISFYIEDERVSIEGNAATRIFLDESEM
jgi:lipopolysaccharide export system protein LptA